MTTTEATENAGKITKDSPDSIQQPIWHVCVIGFFSFGTYLVYWFYKTIRDLKRHAIEEAKKEKPTSESFESIKHYANAKPWLRTLAFFIPLIEFPLYFTPIYSFSSTCIRVVYPLILVFLFANLFKDIATIIPNQESKIRKNPVQAALLLVLAIPFFLTLAGANGLAYLLYLLVVIPFAVAQNWLNQYWKSIESDNHALRTAFTPIETLIIIGGALWMGLVLFNPNEL